MKHGADLDKDALPSAMQTPLVNQAMEVLDMLSQNEIERERYHARLKWERDQTAFIDEAREDALQEGRTKGLQEGRTKGLEEGRTKGEFIGRIHLSQRLLKSPRTPTDELLAQSLEELEVRARSLEIQLGIAEA